VARALIVGCGCRGRELGGELVERGWQVRGTSRSPDRLAGIEATGIEAALADPDVAASILDRIEGVTLIFWLLGSAAGTDDQIGALHGPRLERLLEEIVDTPVRGFVYEAAGTAPAEHLRTGSDAVRGAGERWRIPFELVDAEPANREAWLAAMLNAVERLIG
jgi:uncharacterized protein YbjT (DUF2867 family)